MSFMKMLPTAIYGGEEHVQDFQEAVQEQTQKLLETRDELYRQLTPATATWGLSNFEREYAILPDLTKPQEQRLSRWRAKRRGQGTTTKEMIQLMASSFTGGDVEVTEHTGNYLVEIKFVGTWGVPSNVKDLEQSIREVLPAHLDLKFSYKYLTFGRLTEQNISFGSLSSLGLTMTDFTKGEWTDGKQNI